MIIVSATGCARAGLRTEGVAYRGTGGDSSRRDSTLDRAPQKACRCGSFARAGGTGVARGFTMLELLLVLGVIVAFMAVSIPAIHGPLQNYRLRKAADLVRARWAKARSTAMRNGQTMVFRFLPGQSQFQVLPWESESDLVESSLFLAGTAAGGTVVGSSVGAGGIGATANINSGTNVLGVVEELPDGVIFVGLEGVVNVRDAVASERLQMATGGSDGWSGPILFYPDGTTSTVRLVLGNNQGQFVMLKLRGLSGVAEVSDLLSADELAVQ